MIQEGFSSNEEEDANTLRAHEESTIEEPYYICDSNFSITFTQNDHPPAVPRPGHAPLVLKAQIGGYETLRVFMDGGSSMNIIFTDTLRQMSIPRSVWKKSHVTLYGVVPDRAASSLGQIRLDVVFVEKGNYRKELIDFEIVDWESQYHAILGRPAFVQFMVIPHYAYLKLKMPGPTGTITVHGCFVRSDQCDRDFYQLSDTLGA